jgi:ketosteroid isomerase-like protein
MTMAQILTREHVENFRRARLTRDPRQIGPFLDDNVDWLVTGPVELLSFCGHRRGRAAVLDCITRLQPAVLNVQKVELSALLIDGDRAATFSRLIGVQPGTGRTISYHQAQFLRFRDGKIVECRGIIDSFDAAEQMIGHPIALADSPGAIDDGERIAV